MSKKLHHFPEDISIYKVGWAANVAKKQNNEGLHLTHLQNHLTHKGIVCLL